MPILTSGLTPDYVYDDSVGQYRDVATGRFVSREAVRDELDRVIRRAEIAVVRETNWMINGTIEIGEWQMRMANLIRIEHTAAAAAGAGGWANMDASDWGRVGQELRQQYAWLENFARDVESGRLTPEQIVARARMYSEAARGSYEQARRYGMKWRGAVEERRILGDADHCDCCVEQANRGWQPIGSLLAIGECTCIVNCKCTFVYRDEFAKQMEDE